MKEGAHRGRMYDGWTGTLFQSHNRSCVSPLTLLTHSHSVRRAAAATVGSGKTRSRERVRDERSEGKSDPGE